MSRRQQSVAETVINLPHALNQAVLLQLTLQQRKALTSEQASSIAAMTAVTARAIGRVLEDPQGIKPAVSLELHNSDRGKFNG